MLAPYARAKGAKLLCITANPDSECAARRRARLDSGSAGSPALCHSALQH